LEAPTFFVLLLMQIFWVFYVGGMALIPRQFKQESENRKAAEPLKGDA
jgi:hypothetical protein